MLELKDALHLIGSLLLQFYGDSFSFCCQISYSNHKLVQIIVWIRSQRTLLDGNVENACSKQRDKALNFEANA